MATMHIDRRKVDEVVKEVSMALGSGRYHVVEVLVGVSEVLGRTIVSQDVTPIAMVEMAEICGSQIKSTIVVGAKAKGFNVGESH